MNKKRKQEFGDVVDILDDAIDRLNEIREDEQYSFDNLPEGLQNSATGERMEEYISEMDEIEGDIRDVQEKLGELMK